jgi:hypothetical protein
MPTNLPSDYEPIAREERLKAALAIYEPAKALVMGTMEKWINGEEPVWPYAKILHLWGPDFEMYRKSWRRRDASESIALSAMRTVAMHQLRDDWINTYGFAIPCAELLDELATSDFILEVGAGSGYMTNLMRRRGIRVLGTDYAPPGKNEYRFDTAQYDPYQVMIQGKTAVRRYREADTVFCSWPSYDHTWFRQMLKAMQIGQRLIVIREDATGDETAWNYFDESFEETKEHRHVQRDGGARLCHGVCARYERDVLPWNHRRRVAANRDFPIRQY